MSMLKCPMRYTSFCLKIACCWPIPRNASKLRRYFDFLHFLFVFGGLILISIQGLVYAIMQANDPLEIIKTLSTQVIYLHAAGKVGIMRLHRHKFNQLLDSIERVRTTASGEFLRYREDYTRVGNIAYRIYSISVFIIMLDYIIQPSWKKSQSLPTGAWYPFDYKRSTFFYILAYSQQIICITFCSCTSTTEITFGVFVFYACARLKVLQRKFRHLSDNSNGSEKMVRRKICDYVEQHCDILRYINDINETYTFIVLVLFVSILLTVCCTSFLIINVAEHSLNSIFINSLLMVASAIQLLFYYLPGHILIEEAKKIEESVYSSGWESLSINCRKLLLQIMVHNAPLINLRNGKMGLLILENYTTFLTTAGSYLTSLRSIVGKV